MTDESQKTTASDILKSVVQRQNFHDTEMKNLLKAVTLTNANVNNLADKFEASLVHTSKQIAPIESDVKRLVTRRVEPTTVMGAIMLVLALWAAAIQPNNKDIYELQQAEKISHLQDIKDAEFRGEQKQESKYFREEIKNNTAQILDMRSNRFTSDHGKSMAQDIKEVERRVMDHQISRGHQ